MSISREVEAVNTNLREAGAWVFGFTVIQAPDLDAALEWARASRSGGEVDADARGWWLQDASGLDS